MAANLTSMISLISSMKVPQPVDPVTVRLPSPPALEGALAPNDYLTKAQAYAFNLINGPESMVVVNRYIYTGLKDGWVVEIQPSGHVRQILRMSIRSCGQPGSTEGSCGRPLGVRADAQGYLVVADAYNGIFRINPVTGQFRQLVDGRNQVVNGKPLRYINDLAVAKDGSIYFSSSSTKWKPSQILNIMFEGETSGRVLVYNPNEILAARRVQELVTNLHYPNGLQLSPDESFLLIGEGGRCRIHRAWVSRNSPKFGTIDTFADNLPGNVDNIRLSPRDTYWVGLSRARHATLPSVMDSYGHRPEVRRNLITLASNNMVFDDPSFGIVVELNSEGQIVRSLQDPTGRKYTSVSEVEEENGLLFIASKSKNYIGIINLNTLPPPNAAGPGIDLFSLPSVNDVDMKQLLSQVSQRLQQLDERKLRSMVLLLVQHLYEAKMQARQALDEVSRLRQELDYMSQAVGGEGPTTTAGSITDWPIGGESVSTSSSSSSSSSPDTTTNAAPSTSTTTDSGIAPPPDMGGSSGLSGSVDGGVSGVVTTTERGDDTTTQTTTLAAEFNTTEGAASSTQAGTTTA